MMAFDARQGTRASKSAAPVIAAPAGVSLPAPARFTPIVVAEDLRPGIAYELNRLSEGLHLKHLVTVIKKAATVPNRVTALRPAPHLRRTPAPVAPKAEALASFGPMETSAGPLLRRAARAGQAKRRGKCSRPGRREDRSRDHPGRHARRRQGPLRRDGRRGSRGCRWIRSAPVEPKFARPRPPDPAPAMAPAAITARKVEPIEVPNELYVGVAFELNRRNDGINFPSVARRQVEATREEVDAPGPRAQPAVS